jgi:hypothetical protein
MGMGTSGLKFIKNLTGGGNAVATLWETASGQQIIMKRSEEKSRIRREYQAIRFLRQQGFRNIPEPLGYHPGEAVYRLVNGVTVSVHQAKEGEINQLVTFINQLAWLSKKQHLSWRQPAVEAVFSVKSLVSQIEKREKQLLKLPYESKLTGEMRNFLLSDFCELKKAINAKITPSRTGLRVLSPSDFGFHNVLKAPDGKLVFLDFEYFGWDDPAKLIADTLLHPRMNLPAGLKQRLLDGLLAALPDDPTLPARLRIFYPLLSLKWCLILLNEFVPEKFRRRKQAAGGRLDFDVVRQVQLTKARDMLKRTIKEYRKFPYEINAN